MIAVSSSLGIVGTTMSSMFVVEDERMRKRGVPFDEGGQVMHLAGCHVCCRVPAGRKVFQVTVRIEK
jgi:hypothetical protein